MSTFKNYNKDDFIFIKTKVGSDTPTYGKIDTTLDNLFNETEKVLSNSKNNSELTLEVLETLNYFMGCKGDNKKELKLLTDHVVRFDKRYTPQPIIDIIMKTGYR